jgi:hypothetical protein
MFSSFLLLFLLRRPRLLCAAVTAGTMITPFVPLH